MTDFQTETGDIWCACFFFKLKFECECIWEEVIKKKWTNEVQQWDLVSVTESTDPSLKG